MSFSDFEASFEADEQERILPVSDEVASEFPGGVDELKRLLFDGRVYIVLRGRTEGIFLQFQEVVLSTQKFRRSQWTFRRGLWRAQQVWAEHVAKALPSILTYDTLLNELIPKDAAIEVAWFVRSHSGIILPAAFDVLHDGDESMEIGNDSFVTAYDPEIIDLTSEDSDDESAPSTEPERRVEGASCVVAAHSRESEAAVETICTEGVASVIEPFSVGTQIDHPRGRISVGVQLRVDVECNIHGRSQLEFNPIAVHICPFCRSEYEESQLTDQTSLQGDNSKQAITRVGNDLGTSREVQITVPKAGRPFPVPGKPHVVLNPCVPFVSIRPKNADENFWVLRSGPYIGIFQNKWNDIEATLGSSNKVCIVRCEDIESASRVWLKHEEAFSRLAKGFRAA